MHFKSLLHVRDHSKVQGTAHHLLEDIALHVNMHTGEAFELTVERLAHRLEVTPQWVGQLRRRLVESGELLVKQSRGRHPNVYIIPYERCPACQGVNPKLELRVEEVAEEGNPKVSPSQPQSKPQSEPQSATAPTPKWEAPNLKVGEASTPRLARIEPQKEVKELKEKKERATPNLHEGELEKAERQNPFWCEACGYSTPTCEHRVFEAVRSTRTGVVLRRLSE
jgi:hypothetical protein